MSLLLLDKDQEFINNIRESLEDQGLFDHIFTATTVKEAKTIADEHIMKMFIIGDNLEDGTGMEFVDYLHDNKRCHLAWIILTTTVEEESQSIIDGLNSNYFHRYIRKPVEIDYLLQIVKDTLEHRIVPAKDNRRLCIKRKSKDYFFDYDEIVYIETVEKMAYIYTADDKFKVGRITLTELIELLDGSQFHRIHRSYIVNRDFIDHIKKQNNQNLIKMKHYNDYIPIGRTYKGVLG